MGNKKLDYRLYLHNLIADRPFVVALILSVLIMFFSSAYMDLGSKLVATALFISGSVLGERNVVVRVQQIERERMIEKVL